MSEGNRRRSLRIGKSKPQGVPYEARCDRCAGHRRCGLGRIRPGLGPGLPRPGRRSAPPPRRAFQDRGQAVPGQRPPRRGREGQDLLRGHPFPALRIRGRPQGGRPVKLEGYEQPLPYATNVAMFHVVKLTIGGAGDRPFPGRRLRPGDDGLLRPRQLGSHGPRHDARRARPLVSRPTASRQRR
ncbi:MAG: hypothetical protein MZV64_09840 [Ignavibacteriales bacterium]|nr:hypothetical protein [Ignavibacteriales bacterium]